MKRKLDENNEPATAQPDKKAAEGSSFADLGLDSRLLQAIAQQNFKQPTLVQLKAIPLALEGRDVLAKAKTGSGKTLAFILPILHHILKRKQTDASAATTSLILVPTRELADQIHKVIETISAFCAKDVQSVKLTDKLAPAVLRSLLSASPDIVISTPARAWENVNNSSLSLDKLTHLVLDEADLVLSYGYEEDLQNVARSMPKGVQTILTSATLSPELDMLKGIFCRNPALLDLEEPEAEGEGVSQYVVKCAEDEKFLLIYVIYKLKLIHGKSIIFVADIDRCYRLRLYFEQFGIRSVVLNSELPVNCRINVVEEFNRGVYDIIIASDEHEALGVKESNKENEDESEQKVDKTTTAEDNAVPKKKQKPSKKDKEYGISRGIDFQNVSTVINFDLPTSSKSYTHRIGRTARAGQTGMALSFVIPKANYRKHVPTTVITTENDEKVLDKIIKQQAKKGKEVKPYVFDMAQVDAFRYRMNDALRAVTKVSIREARTRELRQELLNSEKLKRHFEENPQEAHHLRHDGELRAVRTQAHLRATHVPDYLLPPGGRKGLAADEVGFVPFRKQGDRKQRGKGSRKAGGRIFKVGKKKRDPLRSFKARPKSK